MTRSVRAFLCGYTLGVIAAAVLGLLVFCGGSESTQQSVQPPAPVVVGEITKTSPISMEIRGAAKEMLRRNEGVHTTAYRDSEGNWTVGVGFNLARPDANRRLRALGSSKEKLLSGGRLTEGEVEALLTWDLTDVLQDLVTLFPRFDEMPVKAQLVLIDLRFNCGPGGLRTFVNTLKAFQAAQWRDAAQRLAVSQWAEQVGERADRAVGMLKEIS